MNVQDLRSIMTNIKAKPTLPVCVHLDFGNEAKSYTVTDIISFDKFTDVFLLNAKIDDAEIEKIMKFREWLIEFTGLYHAKTELPNASDNGKHYDRGRADALIQARAKLEELFDYWDNR